MMNQTTTTFHPPLSVLSSSPLGKVRKGLLLSFFALSFFLSSCNKDDEIHSVYMVYPSVSANYLSQGFQPVFADQVEDTLAFCSTEAWELVSSDDSWLHVPEAIRKYTNVKSSTLYEVRDLVTFEPNTTGRKRTGTIRINAGEYTITTGYLQLPYLNVHRPMRLLRSGDLLTSVSDSLVAIADSCNVTLDSIAFTTYADWMLTIKQGDWTTLGATSGRKGYNKVYLTLQPNEASTDRTDTIYLTSAGITDAMPIKQYAKPRK